MIDKDWYEAQIQSARNGLEASTKYAQEYKAKWIEAEARAEEAESLQRAAEDQLVNLRNGVLVWMGIAFVLLVFILIEGLT